MNINIFLFMIFLVTMILSFSIFYLFSLENITKILEKEKITAIIKSEQNNNIFVPYKYTDWFSLNTSIKNHYNIETSLDKKTIKITKKINDAHLKNLDLYAIYFKRSSAYDIATSILLESLKNLFNITLTVYFVDYDEELTLKILDEINRKKNKTIVLSVGSDTTDFLFPISQNYENLIFISMTSKDPKTMGYIEDIKTTTGKNFALTSLNMYPEIQYQYIKEFFNKLKNLVIIVDVDNKSSMNTQYLPIKKLAEKEGVNVYPVLVKANQKDPIDINNKFKEQLNIVKKNMKEKGYNKDDTLIIMTGSTILFERYNIINKIFPELLICSMIPDHIIGSYENTASFGIGVTFQKNASLVVEYILKILLGEKPENLPVGFVFPPDISINVTHFREKGFYIPEKLLLASTLIYDY